MIRDSDYQGRLEEYRDSGNYFALFLSLMGSMSAVLHFFPSSIRHSSFSLKKCKEQRRRKSVRGRIGLTYLHRSGGKQTQYKKILGRCGNRSQTDSIPVELWTLHRNMWTIWSIRPDSSIRLIDQSSRRYCTTRSIDNWLYSFRQSIILTISSKIWRKKSTQAPRRLLMFV